MMQLRIWPGSILVTMDRARVAKVVHLTFSLNTLILTSYSRIFDGEISDLLGLSTGDCVQLSRSGKLGWGM